MKLGEDFGLYSRLWRGRNQVDDTDRSFGSNMSDRIHLYRRAPAGRTGEIVGFWPASAPVADISFVGNQHDIIRHNSHWKRAQHFALVQIDLEQLVRKIAAHIKSFAISGNSEPGWDLLLAAKRIGCGQRDGMRR